MIVGQVSEPAFALAENETSLCGEGSQMVHALALPSGFMEGK